MRSRNKWLNGRIRRHGPPPGEIVLRRMFREVGRHMRKQMHCVGEFYLGEPEVYYGPTEQPYIKVEPTLDDYWRERIDVAAKRARDQVNILRTKNQGKKKRAHR